MYMAFEYLPMDLLKYICMIPDDELMDVAQVGILKLLKLLLTKRKYTFL